MLPIFIPIFYNPTNNCDPLLIIPPRYTGGKNSNSGMMNTPFELNDIDTDADCTNNVC